MSVRHIEVDGEVICHSPVDYMYIRFLHPSPTCKWTDENLVRLIQLGQCQYQTRREAYEAARYINLNTHHTARVIDGYCPYGLDA